MMFGTIPQGDSPLFTSLSMNKKRGFGFQTEITDPKPDDCIFRLKAAGHSDSIRPPIPVESGRFLGWAGMRSDAG
jgi:hypothetical protein